LKSHIPAKPEVLHSLQLSGGSGLKVPVGIISISGATQMLAMAASNEALRYVSYPTQVTN
jgi:UDP-galactose transporter B1